MSTPYLGVVEFGKQLIQTGDLDPLYLALYGAKLPREKLCRWLVSYWCYYNAGLSCWVVDQKDFFRTLDRIARGGTDYPRGSERRHFRGNLAIKSVANLSRQFKSALEVVDWLLAAGPRADSIMARVKSLYGFGEWIAGKVPDMLERLNVGNVRFLDIDVELMFDSPKKGAILVFDQHLTVDGVVSVPDKLLAAHDYLVSKLKYLKAPPRYERNINVQETETVFCKWKSHLNGHYPVGKDSHEIREALLKFSRSRTAQTLLKHLPKPCQ